MAGPAKKRASTVKKPALPPEAYKAKARIALIEAISHAVNRVIRWTGICVLAWIGYRALGLLVGHDTNASFVLRLLADDGASKLLSYLFGAGGVTYGVKQRNLRRNENARIGRENSELQKHINPGRTSSRLTPQGTTHPRDAI